MEEQLREALKKVPRYYKDFETAVVLLLEDNEEAMRELIAVIDSSPEARVDDVLDMAEELSDLEEADADEDVQV